MIKVFEKIGLVATAFCVAFIPFGKMSTAGHWACFLFVCVLGLLVMRSDRKSEIRAAAEKLAEKTAAEAETQQLSQKKRPERVRAFSEPVAVESDEALLARQRADADLDERRHHHSHA